MVLPAVLELQTKPAVPALHLVQAVLLETARSGKRVRVAFLLQEVRKAAPLQAYRPQAPLILPPRRPGARV